MLRNSSQAPNVIVWNSKFVLRQKPGAQGEVIKYKAELVVCKYEEHDYQDDIFSQMLDFTI